jgi:hypothetical protein
MPASVIRSEPPRCAAAAAQAHRLRPCCSRATVSAENVSWILNQSLPSGQDGLKFYLIRGSETLYGHLPVAPVKAEQPTQSATR